LFQKLTFFDGELVGTAVGLEEGDSEGPLLGACVVGASVATFPSATGGLVGPSEGD